MIEIKNNLKPFLNGNDSKPCLAIFSKIMQFWS